MPNQCDDCKANPVDIAKKTAGTPTSKLIAVLEAHGITSACALAEIIGISERAVRKARNSGSGTQVPGGTTGPELQDRSGTTVPKTEPQFRNSGSALACAGITTGATKESPTEISVTKIDKIKDMSETDVSDHAHKDTPKARRRFAYTYDFEQFWKAYPVIGNSSKVEAYKEWRKLDSGERSNAQDGLRHLAEHCRKNPTYTCLHACRYLSQRRWESYQTVAERLGAEVVQIASYKPMPQPRREISQAELEAMVLADEAREAARVR